MLGKTQKAMMTACAECTIPDTDADMEASKTHLAELIRQKLAHFENCHDHCTGHAEDWEPHEKPQGQLVTCKAQMDFIAGVFRKRLVEKFHTLMIPGYGFGNTNLDESWNNIYRCI